MPSSHMTTSEGDANSLPQVQVTKVLPLTLCMTLGKKSSPLSGPQAVIWRAELDDMVSKDSLDIK